MQPRSTKIDILKAFGVRLTESNVVLAESNTSLTTQLIEAQSEATTLSQNLGTCQIAKQVAIDAKNACTISLATCTRERGEFETDYNTCDGDRTTCNANLDICNANGGGGAGGGAGGGVGATPGGDGDKKKKSNTTIAIVVPVVFVAVIGGLYLYYKKDKLPSMPSMPSRPKMPSGVGSLGSVFRRNNRGSTH